MCRLFVPAAAMDRMADANANASQKGRTDCPYRENIRVLEMDALEAKGPCLARHLQVADRPTDRPTD